MNLSLLWWAINLSTIGLILLWSSNTALTIQSSNLSWSYLHPSFSFSPFELIFTLTVVIITLHAFLLANLYIPEESHLSSFLLTTSAFVLAIIIFITSESLLPLFLGWDGLGISSFFLIIWYQSWNSLDSGIVTFLSNRIGDFFLILSSISFLTFGWVPGSENYSNTLPFFIIIACFSKSAQIPFSVWLPIAISAPTPISALVHSSTLVTAGLFIVINFYHLPLSWTLFILGCITIITAGSASLLEIDLNKIVALSTLSQLGLIISSLGSGLLFLTFFHIISHAFINSSLFIIVGCYLHSNLGSQDNRIFFISGEWSNPLLTSLSICIIALIGISFTSGIVTNETLLLSLYNESWTPLLSATFSIGVCFTLLYCFRILITCSSNNSSLLLFNETTNTYSSSIILILFSVISAWGFSNNFFFLNPSDSSHESLLLPLLVLCAILCWTLNSSTSSWSTSILGLSTLYNQINNYFSNLCLIDRSYVDFLNWSLLWWTDTFLLLSNSSSFNSSYLLILSSGILLLLF